MRTLLLFIILTLFIAPTPTITGQWVRMPEPHYVVTWQSWSNVCAYHVDGSRYTSLHGGRPCGTSGSFAMPRTGDIGYAASPLARVDLINTEGIAVASHTIPTLYETYLPSLTGP